MSTAIAAQPLALAPAILIVAPDPDSRLLYRTALASVSGTFLEAADGLEAWSKAIAARPDVIVVDTQLLRMDGYTLCSRLRHDRATRSAAIVVITADAWPADIARATDAGADEVLVKPCVPDDLVDAASRSWTHRRLIAGPK